MRSIFFGISILLCFFLTAATPPIRLEGHFLADSVQLGSPTAFVLRVWHDPDKEVRFMDSTYQMAPFEWSGMRYFPTILREGLFYDSVVYYVSTFELASRQYLSIPVYELNLHGDTLFHYTALDSISIAGLYGSQPDDTPLRSLTQYQVLSYALDWRFISLWVVGSSVVLGGGFFFLRRPIRRAWRLYRLQQGFARFEGAINQVLARLDEQYDASLLEQGAALWKAYAERLSGKAFTKFTTREVIREDADMAAILRPIDEVIYRGERTAEATTLVRQLRQAGRLWYERQKIQVQHG